MPIASRFPSRTRLLIAFIAALFATLVLLQQMYSPRRVRAAGFTAGNLVVYRVGDGSSALTANATAVFLDEYTPGGTLVQSIPMPTALSLPQRRLTASGTSTSEGFITRSVDGNYLTLPGYDAAPGTVGVATSTSSTVNRVIGRVDSAGNVDTTTALSDAISGGNPRGAVTTNGTDMWISGTSTGGGIRYATFGATTSTALNTTVGNLRAVNIFGGQLYVSSASGTTRLVAVGTGTPTTSGQTLNAIPGLDTTTLTGPYAFFFADLSAGVAGNDTLYVADEGANAIKKFSLVSGTWVANGSIASTTVRGITGTASGSTATLYVTFSAGTNLSSLTDTSGYNATISGALSPIATPGTNKLFRGVALAPTGAAATPTPTPTPGPTSPTGVGAANPNSVLPGGTSKLTVTVTPGTVPPSTGILVSADLSSIGGSSTQQFFDDGSNGDVTPGDNIFTYTATVSGLTTPGPKTLPFSIIDAQSRTGNGTISLTVQSPPPPSDHVVISQIYGGGGNAGATYQNDYVELYNPTSSTTFNLNGWSVQYAAAAGSGWSSGTVPLAGPIAPGEYYLIKLGTNGAVGLALPPANVEGTTVNMAAASGKIALVNNSQGLTGAVATCPLDDPNLVDFVGYGSANCQEGSATAPAGSNTTAILRNGNGATDTNQNGSDFTAGAPNPRRTAIIVDSPPSVSSTDEDADPFASTPAPRDGSVAVFFSEPVEVIGSWYDLTCVTTGTHTAVVSAGPQNWVITPDVNFLPGEQCTIQIFAANVKDSDTDDSQPNTDFMQSDYSATFTVATGAAPGPTPGVHLTMGNPSNATTDINQPNNYLLVKPELAISYNRDRGGPNWVSWHLSDDWTGSLTRVDTFRPDPALPSSWNRVNQFDYQGSGFDRGHMTPSADRLFSLPINQATFLMDNIIPQAPDNNQQTWNNMEQALRTYTPANELYIVSGGAGIGGTGSNGFANTIAGGRITVPAYTWKVALVIPKGDNDISRVSCASRTIAVIVPNTQGTNPDWTVYLTSVDAVETLTGYDFFSNLPDAVENCVEASVNGTNAVDDNATVAEDSGANTINVLANDTDTDGDTLTVSAVTQGSHGSVANNITSVSYTPAANYFGPDSFTYTVTDGHGNSDTATVSITVTNVPECVTPTNVALASYGATASASSEYSANFPASGAIDGEHNGNNWGAAGAGGWNDQTRGVFPDNIQVNFNVTQTIGEIDVYTLKNQPNNGSTVNDTTPATSYGITNFNVQYWTGSIWTDVPGGAVTGNTLAKRKFIFVEVMTDKIRVVVNDSADHLFSRVVEIEAFSCAPVVVPPPPPTPTPTPTPCPTNVALTTNGSTAVASSQYSANFPPSGAIDGEHNGNNWGAGGGWNDQTRGVFPDNIQINFNTNQTINDIDVYTLKNQPNNGSTVNDTTPATSYGITIFNVQYWTGTAWTDVPGGAVTGNTLAKRRFQFAPITTDKIRVVVTDSGDHLFSRVVEIEAFSCNPVAVRCVNTGGTGGCFSTIQAAINASNPGDAIDVAPGSYNENLTLAKRVTLRGAKAGVDARGRVSGSPNPAIESIVTSTAANTALLDLNTGCAQAVIDGFAFSAGGGGGTVGAIRSTSGPIDGVQLLNNHIAGFKDAAIWFNRGGIDVILFQNVMDGSGMIAGSQIVFLNSGQTWSGLRILRDWIKNGGTRAGLFVDSARTVNPSVNRIPQINQNLFDGNNVGINMGSQSFDGGEVSGNTFSNNVFDGLQGGPRGTFISGNTFSNNGRHGLALTSFGNTNPPRGAQNCTVTCNTFTGNGFTNAGSGILFSGSQPAGTISSNHVNSNNISGNNIGASYTGTESIDAENNWWGSASGPTIATNPGGTGDSIVDTNNGIDYSPFLTSAATCAP
jgi:DNA/RNA endonuclease G (NUC1)